ncbi:hypothetical protein StoSoilA2_21270 [Arthrobacter sp. StoSoilA2]|uniref:DUF624 domain-containing protein n=1 Tax=unclassified Arthrobacter TaxID=235627 RepID=UPI001CC53A70|nr:MULTISPECIES: DUF624 domain-containing protein [unclassified Arthrobacter]BCW36071.1 hypothetical protein StoSoilA2_21270 [Arthrobacter sp. StoSoilA2]BCW48160.1 hypothetical protein StoSoilB13_05020 [Arthrobacter sp. StoSoilB13]
MNKEQNRSKGAAVTNAFEVTGEVLLLQLLFLVASIPLLTAFPAAIALQRAFQQVVLDHRPGTTRRFLREFVWAWRRVGWWGILATAFAAAATFAILFWLSTPGMLGTLALCVLIPICGAAAAVYLAVLGGAMNAGPDTGARDLWEEGMRIVFKKPLFLAAAVIALATWGVLALRLPTLIPVFSGLVPALLAWLLVRRPADARSRQGG